MANLNISDGSMGDALEKLGVEHFTVWNDNEVAFITHCRHKATKELVVCPKTGENCRAAGSIKINSIAESVKLACEYLSYKPAETDPMVSMQSRLDSLEKTNADLLKAVQQLTGAGSPPTTEENTEPVPDGMDERMPGDTEQTFEDDDPGLTPEDQEILDLQDKVAAEGGSPPPADLLEDKGDEEDIYQNAPPPPEPENSNEPELLDRAKKLKPSNLDD